MATGGRASARPPAVPPLGHRLQHQGDAHQGVAPRVRRPGRSRRRCPRPRGRSPRAAWSRRRSPRPPACGTPAAVAARHLLDQSGGATGLRPRGPGVRASRKSTASTRVSLLAQGAAVAVDQGQAVDIGIHREAEIAHPVRLDLGAQLLPGGPVSARDRGETCPSARSRAACIHAQLLEQAGHDPPPAPSTASTTTCRLRARIPAGRARASPGSLPGAARRPRRGAQPPSRSQATCPGPSS